MFGNGRRNPRSTDKDQDDDSAGEPHGVAGVVGAEVGHEGDLLVGRDIYRDEVRQPE
jgi:hypothetical protein